MKPWPVASQMPADQWRREMDAAWTEWVLEEMARGTVRRCRYCGFTFDAEAKA